MREVAFKLEKGKEVPERLDGTEIRYTLPSSQAECLEVCGGDEAILVSVFNEGFNLNHRQKIAKRFAAKEGSTIETITAGMNAHKPAIRADRDPSQKRAVTSARKAVENDMLAELERTDPQLAAKYRERLAAIAPKPKAKAAEGEAATPVASDSAPVAADPTTENQAKRRR